MDDSQQENGFVTEAIPQPVSSPHHEPLGAKVPRRLESVGPVSRFHREPLNSKVSRRVLIVGGSTRAAAWSAVRAGLKPICADLFADLDTRQIAEIVSVRDYPISLPEDVSLVPADGWFYTGALENHPDLVEQMSRPEAPYGPLWGTSPAALRMVRDPFWIAGLLRAASLPVLDVLPETSPPQADATWLQKPLASAGGRAIRVWDHAAASHDLGEPHYFQRRAPGDPLSAVFQARGDGEVEWLGATRQLIHTACSHASIPFAYCGSFGPIELPRPARETVTLMAQVLGRASRLQGLFGLDFLLDRDEVWVTELNPRYTASVEVLELARQRSLLWVPGGFGSPQAASGNGTGGGFAAKIILYARQSQEAPDLSRFLSKLSPWQVPYVADVPVPGSSIDSGWPICTVLADGTSEQHCRSNLEKRVRTIFQRFLSRQTFNG